LEILIKNSGITPAYHVINLVGGALLPFPFPFSEKRVQPGPGMMKIASVFFLPNGGVSTAFANVDGAPVPLTAEQKRLLGDGRAAIYLYGYIVYYDAFEIMRCTRYNYYVGGDAGFNGTDMKNGTEWQDVDKNCYEPAEVPPPLILPEVPHYQF
jgi:hypothetical protein